MYESKTQNEPLFYKLLLCIVHFLYNVMYCYIIGISIIPFLPQIKSTAILWQSRDNDEEKSPYFS